MRSVFVVGSVFVVAILSVSEMTAGVLFASWFAGADPAARIAWTTAAFGSSIGLVVAPLWICWGRDRVQRGAAVGLLALCMGFGGWTVYGFAKRTSAVHAAEQARDADRRAALVDARRVLAETAPVAGTAAGLTARLAEMQQSRRWRSTSACTDVTAAASVRFCDEHSATVRDVRIAQRRETALATLQNASGQTVTDTRNANAGAIILALFLQLAAGLSGLAAFGARPKDDAERIVAETQDGDDEEPTVAPIPAKAKPRLSVVPKRKTTRSGTSDARLIAWLGKQGGSTVAGLRSIGEAIGVKSASGVKKVIERTEADGRVVSEVTDHGTKLTLRAA